MSKFCTIAEQSCGNWTCSVAIAVCGRRSRKKADAKRETEE